MGAAARIFERFYRVDKSRSKETGGTGLGLAIVRHIAICHGAQVKLFSKPGEGTQITVYFAGRKERGQESPPPHIPDPPAHPVPKDGGYR